MLWHGVSNLNIYIVGVIVFGIFGFAILIYAWLKSMDVYVCEYAHDITKGLGDVPNTWLSLRYPNHPRQRH